MTTSIQQGSFFSIPKEIVIEAIDELNYVDDFLTSKWIEHDLTTDRINMVLCAVLKKLNQDVKNDL